MRIAEIEFYNWLCFRGEHTLKLEAKSYGIFARREDNPEASNWNGKTAVLEGINFALHGSHRWRTEDEWITRGEPDGQVRLVLDDGTVITRSRTRGKRTTLTFVGPGAQAGALQDEAQLLVAQTIGMDEADFLNTCYFQQRQMAHLVLAEPSKRMEIVSGWLRLGPLERCYDDVAQQASQLADEVGKIEAQLVTLEGFKQNALAGDTHVAIAKAAMAGEDAVIIAKAKYDEASARLHENADLLAAQRVVADFESLVREGKALRAEVEAVDEAALKATHDKTRAKELELNTRLRSAQTAERSARELSQGNFDGKCPVAGILCPAKDDINQDRKRGLKVYQEAKDLVAELDEPILAVRRAEQSARAALQEHERKVARLEALRKQAMGMEGAYEQAKAKSKPENQAELREEVDQLQRKWNEAKDAHTQARNRHERLEQIATQEVEMDKRLHELRGKVATMREAMLVFGKQGAQRRVAEGALGDIEEDANASLRESGMDLSISVQWSREGSSPSRACDACGAPFPASTKVKVCSRCHAARGLQQVNKLDFVLSDKSGAAEDLAGVNFKLAASAWLRRERGILWETALLDEPYGQLDAHNRKALGRHLAGLLAGRYGFTQAFVVAHSSDVLEALPGRIEVIGGPNGSKVRVIA